MSLHIVRRAFSVFMITFFACISTACSSQQKTPQQFVEQLYETYIQGNSQSTTLQLPEKVYSKALSSLIVADATSAPKGEMGKLNFEPLCACQDPGGFNKIQIEKPLEAALGYMSKVTLLTEQDQKVITLMLVKESGFWRVDDVSSPEIPSLRTYLSIK